MANNLALHFPIPQMERERVERGAGSKLYPEEAKCKRMRFPVILGTLSRGASVLNRKTKWLPISRLFLALF